MMGASSCATSIYHALGASSVASLRALLTLQPADIATAVAVNRAAVGVCDAQRKTFSLAEQMIARVTDTSQLRAMSERQMHAELCYAEALLQSALLALVADESLAALVKAAVAMRACYAAYSVCAAITPDMLAEQRRTSDHFTCGVLMGTGAFALLVSTLPARVCRLLQCVGMTADRVGVCEWTAYTMLQRHGLAQLARGALHMPDTLRSPLCAVVLLAWHLQAVFVVDTGEADLLLAQRLLNHLSAKYPTSSLVLYFVGRYQIVSGRLDAGDALLTRAVTNHGELHQMRHLCYWELMFCHAYRRQWTRAAHFAQLLYGESRWSRCTYAYMAAVFLHAMQPSHADVDAQQRVDKYFKQVILNWRL